jgi:hypothetical protein
MTNSVEMPFRHPARWYSRAFDVAAHRTLIAFEKGRVQKAQIDPTLNRFETDCVGCLGESAVAAWLGVDWGAQDTCDYAGDVGDLHVRSTTWPNGHLIVYPTDPVDGRFVLVTLDYSRCCANLVGWCSAGDAMQAAPLKTHPKLGIAGHWVSQSSGLLRPMHDLKSGVPV